MTRAVLAFAATLVTAALAATPVTAAGVPPEVEFGMPSRDLGKAAGRCRSNEAGPAALVAVMGLKDRAGLLRAELYPANDADFLNDDKILVREGKTFTVWK
jgi:hypothetical protein